MNIDLCGEKEREMNGGERTSVSFLHQAVPQGGIRRGREEGTETVDIRIIIIIQLKGYSPTRSLMGGDELFQAYHSTA